jgi:hypothetical protein
VRRQSRARDRTATNVEVGVKKRMRLNSQCINQIRISGNHRGYSPSLPIAWTFLGMGDLDSSLRWMEIALDEREPYLASTSVFPGYDPLRSHKRFIRLQEQIGARYPLASGPPSNKGLCS